ncbi:MAG: DUF3108 domain-containing protein [Methylotenera sp.]|uniref:DUF3108 domain-containing protein n=1 Tax=Methylotenera sp. TaxID=2051956 RepID=UPI0027284259|nr:DUF3108 domain-containing protein [Methylotenera sp.]MDO9151862.1 DUF3108 domain-containing protein [Methylotenera sp.]
MKLSTLKSHITDNKSLLIAAFISLVLHTFLLSGYSISLPSDIKNITSIHVRLVKVLPEKKPTQPTATQAHQNSIAPNPKVPNNEVPKPDVEVPEHSLNSENTSTSPDIPTNIETTTEPTNSSLKEKLLAEDTTENTTTAETDSSVNTDMTNPYTFVHSEFEVTRGGDSGILGIAYITFNMDSRKNTYQLTSITEPKGLASIFLSKLEQYSEGNVDEKGLKPSYYAYEFGANSGKNQYAHLLWSDGVIEMTSNKGKKSEPLPEGTQDFLSFMYQFMFTPPLNVMQITMTNGKYLRTYTYSFEGEETISTKLGDLKTLHLLKSGENQEKTEVWLALDYQNIPVRIRKTEKDGAVLEQTVTTISTTRPE